MNNTSDPAFDLANLTALLSRQAGERTALHTWFAVMMTLSVTGTAINAMTLTVIFFQDKLRSGSGLLIAHSLFLYGCMCAIHFPVFTLTLYGKRVWHWTITDHHCTYITSINMATAYTVNWCDACLALNRLLAVNVSDYYTWWSSRKVTVANLVLCWGFGIFLALLACFGIGGKYALLPVGACNLIPVGVGGVVVFAFGVYVPVGLVGLFYGILFLRVFCLKYRSIRRVSTATESVNKRVFAFTRTMKRRINLAQMLFGSFLWYCLCLFPAPIMNSFFRSVYFSSPLIFLWLRLVFACGYAVSPVRSRDMKLWTDGKFFFFGPGAQFHL